MGLDQIIAEIKREAGRRSENLISEAEEEAAETVAKARIKAERVAVEGRERAELEAASQKEQGIASARLKARDVVLTAKRRLLDDAYRLAEDRLNDLSRSERLEWLTRLIVEHADGDEEVVLGAEDRKSIGQALVRDCNAALEGVGRPGHLRLAPEAGSMSAGVILVQGRVEKNLSAPELLESAREETEEAVAAVLLGADR